MLQQDNENLIQNITADHSKQNQAPTTDGNLPHFSFCAINAVTFI